MRELRPAHEVILDKIVTHCNNVKHIDKGIAQGGVTSGGGSIFHEVSELRLGRSQEIGGLCTLLEVLRTMVIPEDKLPEVIEELGKIDYTHALISDTIEKLSERMASPQFPSMSSTAKSQSTM